MTYISTKTYGHDVGLSVAFRQWRADSHCRHIHGYALKVRLEFEAEELDHRNWVIDFGGLKRVKAWLQDYFDHTLLVAEDDPRVDLLLGLEDMDVAKVRRVPNTGCEAFAEMIFEFVVDWLIQEDHWGRVKLKSVEVAEHGANSAIYTGPTQS